MAWVQVFPTGSTLISQSVAQIQANWLFIQNNMNVDHYFDDVTNEGHHRFSQYVNQGADPVLATNGGEIYTKNMGNVVITPQPFYANSTNIRQIGTLWTGVQAIGAGITSIFNCVGQAPFYGWLHVVNAAVPNDYGTAFIFWNGGATVTVRQQFVSGSITSIQVLAGTSVGVGSGGGITVQWAVHSIPL